MEARSFSVNELVIMRQVNRPLASMLVRDFVSIFLSIDTSTTPFCPSYSTFYR